jgi:acyl-CoA thioester hydrolase
MSIPPLNAQNFDVANQHWKEVRVYYEDTDFTGMVYHANYLRFFERGRSDHLRDSGVSHQSLLEREDPAAFTLTRVEVDFKSAARVDDLLHICTRFSGYKGVRMFFDQICLRGDEVIAQAKITAIMIHPDGRPRRILADFQTHMQDYIWTPPQG